MYNLKDCIFNKHFLFSKLLFLLLVKIAFIYLILFFKKKSKLKIGVVGVRHEANIGNNLLKYAMFTKLKELGYIPYIIGTLWDKFNNIEFINQTTNLVIIKSNYSEIKMDDYDILMVNSDQTWVKFDNNFYDYGFLRFAENWTTPKFVYGASIGGDYWKFSKKDEETAKKLLKKFSGISIREKDSIDLIKKHLEIKPEIVLDPTFLIDKQYYLNLIKEYKENIIDNNNYIFTYIISQCSFTFELMKKSSKILNLNTHYFPLNNNSSVRSFLYYLINCKCVITNSFHGTVFAIIFNKPFISVYNNKRKTRFNSLRSILNISERLLLKGKQPNYNLLMKPLNINYNKLKVLKQKSINFIKKSIKI